MCETVFIIIYFYPVLILCFHVSDVFFLGDPHADKILRLQQRKSNREFFVEVRSPVCY